jgi:hypothetical protein
VLVDGGWNVIERPNAVGSKQVGTSGARRATDDDLQVTPRGVSPLRNCFILGERLD